jgi:hypothetical protein
MVANRNDVVVDEDLPRYALTIHTSAVPAFQIHNDGRATISKKHGMLPTDAVTDDTEITKLVSSDQQPWLVQIHSFQRLAPTRNNQAWIGIDGPGGLAILCRQLEDVIDAQRAMFGS